MSETPPSRAVANPFSPRFGVVPGCMVGRGEEITDILDGLRQGVLSDSFASLLLGERGTGKTAMLNSLCDVLAEEGWVVVRVDASTKGLLGRIAAGIERAVRESGHVALDPLRDDFGARIASLQALGVGASWEGRRPRTESPKYGVREHLELLAQAASEAGCSVVLTVDELHSIDREEARRLFNDYQHVSSNLELPLAFVGAGLSWMENTLLRDNKITFLQRCLRRELQELTILDAMRGIREPILQAGGRIDDEALGAAAEAAAGRFPYKLQLIGHGAWQVAGAPENEIGMWEVSAAIGEAKKAFAQNVSTPAWFELADSDQDYLSTLASLGGEATRAEIGRAARRVNGQMAKAEQRLAAGGYISVEGGAVRIGEMVPTGTVAEFTAMAEEYGRAEASEARCANWMPRAQANCVLSPGHSGRCRSRL